MKREEIAAVQKLELDQLAEQEITEMRREARQARDRIDSAADSIGKRLGLVPQSEVVPPIVPVVQVEAATEKPADKVPEAKKIPQAEPDAEQPKNQREPTNFADIAANIAGDDWKDL